MLIFFANLGGQKQTLARTVSWTMALPKIPVGQSIVCERTYVRLRSGQPIDRHPSHRSDAGSADGQGLGYAAARIASRLLRASAGR
jgi:hypothetical protein